MSSLFYTHVNRGTIDSNRKHGRAEPVITVKHGKSGKPWYAHEVELPSGSRMVYSSGDPVLPCGARCVIISESEPKKIA